MRNKIEREKLEGLLAEIHATTSEAGSDGEICLSPMLGESVDAVDHSGMTEGEDYDELSS